MSDFVIKNGNEWPQVIPAATGDIEVDSITMPKDDPELQNGGTRTVIYVRNDGDDSNDGWSEDTALLTIQAALDRVPLIDRQRRYIIEVTGFTNASSVITVIPPYYGGDQGSATSPDFSYFSEGGYVTFQAVPTEDTALTALLDAGGASPVTGVAKNSVSNLNIITTGGAALTVDAFKGKLISGAGSGQFAVIIGNTATEIMVGSASASVWTGPFIIYDRSCTLSRTTASNTYFLGRNIDCNLAMNGLFLSGTTGSRLSFDYVRSFNTNGCDIAGMTLSRCASTSHSAIYLRSNGMSTNGSVGVGGLVEGPVSRAAGNPGNTVFSGVGFRSTSALALSTGASTYATFQNCDVRGTGLSIAADSTVQAVLFHDVTGNCVNLSNRARLTLNGKVQGTSGNTGVGLAASGGSLTSFGAGTPSVDITFGGATGDIRVGTLPVRSWSSFFTQTPVAVETDTMGDGTTIGLETNIQFFDLALTSAPVVWPSSGQRFYVDAADGLLKSVDSAGTVRTYSFV